MRKWGFAIHGGIDGFSRKILSLVVATTNNDPLVVGGDFLLGGRSLRQAFIQAVSLMTVFEQKLSFGMFRNTGGCLKVIQVLQRTHGGALEGVQGVNSLKKFGIFTSGGQTNISK